MSEEIKLDAEGSYMATKLSEKLKVTPQRAARFAFMLAVLTLTELEDPRATVARVMALLDDDEEILERLPRDFYRHDVAALVIAALEKMGMNGSRG